MKRNTFRKLVSIVSWTNWMIFANVIAFIAFMILLAINNDYFKLIEINPKHFIEGKSYWTALTSMFMHQGGFHLFVNMLSLFFLGNLTEKIVGRKRLLLVYFAAGILGALFFVASAYFGSAIGGERVFGSVDDYAAGASGAIFGLLGLLAVLIPSFRVFLIAGPILIIIAQVVIGQFIPESLATGFGFLMSILMFVSIFGMFSSNKILRRLAWPIEMPLWVAPIAAIVPLVLISLFVRLPIGNSAHLGGLIAGLIYGSFLRMKYAKKVMLLQRYFTRRT